MGAPEILALAAASSWALGDTSARVALRTSTPSRAPWRWRWSRFFCTGRSRTGILSSELISFQGIVYLLGAGIALGLARTLLNMSFGRVGLARSTSIVSASPLISVAIGVVWLAERPSWIVFAGTLLIVAGVTMVARERQWRAGESGRRQSVGYALILAVLATVMFGLTTVLRKAGISLVPILSVGLCVAAIGTLGVIACWCPFPAQGRTDSIQPTEHRILRYQRPAVQCEPLGAVLQPFSTARFPSWLRSPIPIRSLFWSFPGCFSATGTGDPAPCDRAFMICAGAALVTVSSG